MTKPFINVADAPTHTGGHGEHFAFTMTELAGALGARSIGSNLTRVPPGKASVPFHHHYANEEHFFVLGGFGVLRFGQQTYAVKQHDYIVKPAGGPDHAHQLINTGQEELVYLAISTNIVPEVVGYPDSRKTGVRTSPPEQEGSRFLVSDTSKKPVDYWVGEDGERVAAIVAGDGA